MKIFNYPIINFPYILKFQKMKKQKIKILKKIQIFKHNIAMFKKIYKKIVKHKIKKFNKIHK